MEQFEQFAAKHNITTTAKPTTRDCDWKGVTWTVSLFVGDNLMIETLYTKGIGHAEKWAQKLKNKRLLTMVNLGAGPNLWECYNPPLPFGKRYRDDSKPVLELSRLYSKYHTPSPAEVLLSLQIDSRDCDVPFNDFADCFGYNPDSIKHKKIWEECNHIRRAINAAFSTELLDEFWRLEE